MVLEPGIVEQLLGQQLIQPAVLVLQSPQSASLRYFQAAELCLPLVEGRPCRRHSSSALAPASCSFKIPMICSSVKRLLLIVDLLAIDSTISWREIGEQVTPSPPMRKMAAKAAHPLRERRRTDEVQEHH